MGGSRQKGCDAMNRRELLKTAFGTACSLGITDVHTLEVDEGTIALVLKSPHPLSTEARLAIRRSFTDIFKGGPIEHVPVIVLECGMSLEAVKIHDADKVDDANWNTERLRRGDRMKSG